MKFQPYDLVEVLTDQEPGVRQHAGALVVSVLTRPQEAYVVEVLGVNGAPSVTCTLPPEALRLVRRANQPYIRPPKADYGWRERLYAMFGILYVLGWAIFGGTSARRKRKD